ncbi:hypothetical protein F5Y13DRAFT_185758 [Hypoxylon sp. FL1857]|nr:hypothetical protein F5Y13DRAFT_185758 [Hypoxylon sp. FL1857]
MAWSTTARTSFAVCLSSAVTVITLLLLIRPGHDNIITTFVDGVRTGSPVSAATNTPPKPKECPVLGPSQELSPTRFVRDPWKYPVYNREKTSGKVDWWDSLLTPNGGFLMVEEQDHEINKYGVSMFHQLHCLSMIRTVLLSSEMHMDHVRVESRDMESAMDRGHFLHCFDYIVQAILCSADDTLERSGKVLVPGGEAVDGINGMGQTHQCRNATLLYDYVLQLLATPYSRKHLNSHDNHHIAMELIKIGWICRLREVSHSLVGHIRGKYRYTGEISTPVQCPAPYLPHVARQLAFDRGKILDLTSGRDEAYIDIHKYISNRTA